MASKTLAHVANHWRNFEVDDVLALWPTAAEVDRPPSVTAELALAAPGPPARDRPDPLAAARPAALAASLVGIVGGLNWPSLALSNSELSSSSCSIEVDNDSDPSEPAPATCLW